jgi:hypothetical protein
MVLGEIIEAFRHRPGAAGGDACSSCVLRSLLVSQQRTYVCPIRAPARARQIFADTPSLRFTAR